MKKLQVPFSFADQHGIFTVPSQGESQKDPITAYCRNNVSIDAMAEVTRYLSAQSINFNFLTDVEYANQLSHHYQSHDASLDQHVEDVENIGNLDELASLVPANVDLLTQEHDAPIISLLNGIFKKAIQRNASDIHIQSFSDELKVQYRIDGVLYDILSLEPQITSMLISRIKILAGLDIAEKRLPQDGRTSLRLAGHTVDLRVSTMPTKHGERAVLRLLDKTTTRLSLDALGINDTDLSSMKRLLNRPSGIILVTGPTGSGKTTTLYSALNFLNTGSRNILTIEDPIEYDLKGIGQTQTNSKANLDFATGLRAMLRQDPDVVMVGEIRDKQTAEIAIQASLTGHLVLSTLHTNTALGAVTRLSDLGIEPYLISSSITALLAQRLVRRLCIKCRSPSPVPREYRNKTSISQNTLIYQPKGCEFCNYIGYDGRLAIYEWIVLDDTLRQMIHDQASESDLTGYARPLYPSLFDNGWQQVIAGHTSLAELLRVSAD